MPRQQGRTVCFQWYQLSCRELFKLAAVNPASLTCPVPFDSYFEPNVESIERIPFPVGFFRSFPELRSKTLFSFFKDEDSIPVHLRDTDEYRELMELKRLKKQKIAEVCQ